MEACSVLGLVARRCVFVGDSLSDFTAAGRIAMPFIGFANQPYKSAPFLQAGCDLVITALRELETAADIGAED